MAKEEKDYKEILKRQITFINECFEKQENISLEEARKTLMLIGMFSKFKEKSSVYKVSNLKLAHNCHDVLQLGYRLISKEASIALTNPNNENIIIILGQFGIISTLEGYLEKEIQIPLEILDEMSKRTIVSMEKSHKIFKKINK